MLSGVICCEQISESEEYPHSNLKSVERNYHGRKEGISLQGVVSWVYEPSPLKKSRYRQRVICEMLPK